MNNSNLIYMLQMPSEIWICQIAPKSQMKQKKYILYFSLCRILEKTCKIFFNFILKPVAILLQQFGFVSQEFVETIILPHNFSNS